MIKLKTSNFPNFINEEFIFILISVNKSELARTSDLVRNLMNKFKISRSTAYRRIFTLKSLGCIETIDGKEERRKKGILYVPNRIRNRVEELSSAYSSIMKSISKFEQEYTKIKEEMKKERINFEKQKNANQLVSGPSVETISGTEETKILDKGSMASGIFSRAKDSNNELLHKHGMDKVCPARKTKNAQNTIIDKWKFLRTNKITEKSSKNQKKIFSVVY